MGAVERGVIRKLVMHDGSGCAIGGDMHVADVAARPLGRVALPIFDEISLGLPFTPTVSSDEPVCEMLLCPRDVIFHLGVYLVLLQLFNLLGNARVLRL